MAQLTALKELNVGSNKLASTDVDFIIERFPASEYAYRARARLETLRQLGHYDAEAQPAIYPAKP